MIVYTIHEPPEAPLDRLERAAEIELVPDTFSLSAAVLAPLWLLAKRAWAGFGLYVLGIAAAVGVAVGYNLGPGWLMLLVGALHMIVGYEAPSLARMALEKRGWMTIGTVVGRNRDECERRFLEDWLPRQNLLGGLSGTGGAGLASAPAGVASAAQRGAAAGDAEPRRRRWRIWPSRRTEA